MHFSSHDRMQQVLTLYGLCGVDFRNQLTGNRHFCCGKVSLTKNGWQIVGYIIHETVKTWEILLANNALIKLRRGEGYEYPSATQKNHL